MDSAPEHKTGLLLRNGMVAAAAVVIAALVFFASRSQTPSLSQMAEASVPLEQALANGKPTLVEFYTDTCTYCRAMAPTIARLEKRYGERVNFVMLNANNPRWWPEVDQYGVDGVPHYVFLDGRGRRVAEAKGPQPATIFEQNLVALARGEKALPGPIRAGETTGVQLLERQTQPRDHS
jgi:thiol-disulfide isomerase/thioredoxin